MHYRSEKKKKRAAAQVVNIFDIKPTDGATIFANLGKGEKSKIVEL
jgi:transketolase C-terminal domain/subunit